MLVNIIKNILKFIFAVIIFAFLGVFSYYLYKIKVIESKDIGNAELQNGKLVQTSDAEIFIQDIGEKDLPAIVFIHGTGSWGDIWQDTVKFEESKKYRIILFDIPPFGYSSKLKGVEEYDLDKQSRRVIEVMNQLGIDKFNLVAHSAGARVGTEVALRYPERIIKFILVDAAIDPNTAKDIINPIAFSLPTVRNIVISAIATNPSLYETLFKTFVYNKESITQQRVATLLKPLNIKGYNNALADWLQNLLTEKNIDYIDQTVNYSKLNFPTLLIWGDKDTTTPMEQGERLKTFIPKADFTIIKNTGHIPYIENPQKFNEVLFEFLGRSTTN